MSKPDNSPLVPPHAQGHQLPLPGRTDSHGPDEERSFAEIRKILQDVLRILALHPWAFFVPFCLATSIAFVVSLYSPRTYSATTTFERRDDPVALSLDISSGAASFKFFRKTMVQDLKSVNQMSTVVENLGLTDTFERDADGNLTPASIGRRDGIARVLASRLNISTRSPGEFVDQVTIRYTGPDRDIGRRLVDETKNTYIIRCQEWIRDHLVNQREYFQQQAEVAQGELATARRMATKFRLDHPLVDPNNPGSITLRLAQLESERRNMMMQKDGLQSDLVLQEQVLYSLGAASQSVAIPGPINAAGPAVPQPSPETLALAARMQKVVDEIAELRATRGMTMQHPDVVELTGKRDYLQRQLDAQQARDAELGPREQQSNDATSLALVGQMATIPAQIDRALAVGRVNSLKAKLNDVTQRLADNDQMISDLSEAKQNIFENQEEFALVRDRVTRARTEYAKLQSTLGRIDPAIIATEQGRLVKFSAGPPAHGSSLPISPSAKNIVILSIVFGVAAGVLFVILAEILDHVYRSSNHVAKSLGMPILDSIDEIITTHDRRSILVQRLVVAPLILGGGVMTTGLTGTMAYLSLTNPQAYEKVRRIPEAAVQFFAGDLPAQTDLPELRPEKNALPPAKPAMGNLPARMHGPEKLGSDSNSQGGPVTRKSTNESGFPDLSLGLTVPFMRHATGTSTATDTSDETVGKPERGEATPSDLASAATPETLENLVEMPSGLGAIDWDFLWKSPYGVEQNKARANAQMTIAPAGTTSTINPSQEQSVQPNQRLRIDQ
ncbi:MAG: GumC family protein [Phycisphaerae bacterium]